MSRFEPSTTGGLYTLIEKLVAKLAKTRFVRNAIHDNADLNAFREKPSFQVILGVSAIALSYVIGWPVVVLSGTLAVYFKQPLLALAGPISYGLSHLVFLLGMYLAGARYSWIFMRWLTRVTMLKLMRRYPN